VRMRVIVVYIAKFGKEDVERERERARDVERERETVVCMV